MSVADELSKLNQLRESGALSEAEFAAAKSRLLGATEAPAGPPAAKGVDLSVKGNLRSAVKIGAGLLALGFGLYLVSPSSRSSGGKDSHPLLDLAAAHLRSPQEVINQQIVVPAGNGMEMLSFSIPSPRPVKLEVRGVQDADKGFSLYLIPTSDWENIKSHRRFTDFPAFSGLKVRSLTKTGTLEAGEYGIVVMNTENLLNSVIVHVKLTSDPK